MSRRARLPDHSPRESPWPVIAAGAFMIAATTPTRAQEVPLMRPDIKLIGPEGECFARARITNRVGQYHGPVTLETIHGPVTITYATVGAHRPGDDDTFEALDWPDGVSVWPVAGTIKDGFTLDVCLSVGVGG